MEESTTPKLEAVRKKKILDSLPMGKVITANIAKPFDARAVGSSFVAETTRMMGLKLEKNWKVDGSSGLKKFGNVNKGEFLEDQKAAKAVDVEAYRAGTQEFDDLLNTSNRVKWVFTVDNELWAVKAKQVVKKEEGGEGQWGEAVKAGHREKINKAEKKWVATGKWKERLEERGDNKGVKKIQEITHAVAADNKRCYAAGMAVWQQGEDKQRFLVIDNHTGHYQTSPDSLEKVGGPSWKAAGVNVLGATQRPPDWKK